MIIIKLAIRNLVRYLKKTLTIGLLIAIGMALLFIANSIFDSTTDGLYSSFVHSVTGNVVIAEKADTSFGLFGSEIPIVSEYETIPSISSFSEITDIIEQNKKIKAWTALVSGVAQISVNGYVEKIPVFGVNPDSYFDVCSDIQIIEGNVSDIANGGVFINEKMAKKIDSQKVLTIGDEIVFSTITNGSFKLRKGFYAGRYSYVGTNDILNRLVLTDATLVRGLVDYTMGFVSEEQTSSEDETFNQLDDLFSEAIDMTEIDSEELEISEVEEILSDVEERDMYVAEDLAAWSFILLSCDTKDESAILSWIKHQIDKNKLSARVMNWQLAAGTSASMILAVQTAFYVGIIFIAIGAVLVIMNTLVLSVLDRTVEIGTMRGLGAGKPFISKLFIAESMILTLVFAFIGIVCGVIAVHFIARSGIKISNNILVSMFGGSTIIPSYSIKSIFSHLFIAFIIASFSWIYPVYVANNVAPVSAMNSD